jgi:hypothetical protein
MDGAGNKKEGCVKAVKDITSMLGQIEGALSKGEFSGARLDELANWLPRVSGELRGFLEQKSQPRKPVRESAGDVPPKKTRTRMAHVPLD